MQRSDSTKLVGRICENTLYLELKNKSPISRGVVLKKGMGTAFPHQIKRKTAPNSSCEVSICPQEFPH